MKNSSSRTMRILHINSSYLTTPLHQLLIDKLESPGIENRVFAPTFDENRCSIEPADYVYKCKCWNRWDRLCFDLKQYKLIKAIESSCDVASFDMIHSAFLFSGGIAARYLSRKYNVPYITSVRHTDTEVFFPKMPHLRRKGVGVLRDASRIVYLSEAFIDNVNRFVPKEFHSELRGKSCVVPNGIDSFWLNYSPVSKVLHSPLRLVFTGKLIRRKNIPLILKAAEILRRDGTDCRLTVIGAPEDKNILAAVKADPFCEYHEPCGREELRDIYREQDIFIMLSLAESFGLVYAEALSCGLPVVYSHGQGFDSQFEEGLVGVHANPRSPEAAAEAIKTVIANYDSMSSNAPAAARKFDWDIIAGQYAELYRSVVGEHK